MKALYLRAITFMIKYLACQGDPLVKPVFGVHLQWPQGAARPKAQLKHLIGHITPVLAWIEAHTRTQRAFASEAIVKIGSSPSIVMNPELSQQYADFYPLLEDWESWFGEQPGAGDHMAIT